MALYGYKSTNLMGTSRTDLIPREQINGSYFKRFCCTLCQKEINGAFTMPVQQHYIRLHVAKGHMTREEVHDLLDVLYPARKTQFNTQK